VIFHKNMEKLTKENKNFRNVVATGKFSQIVLMSIPAADEIGEETHHHVDQIFIFVQGHGTAVIQGIKLAVNPNDLVMVPAGTKHNFINTGTDDLKLVTFYAPPEHKQGIVRKTKKEAVSILE